VADKTAGCYSGAAGDDTFHQVLGTDGYWDFYFQGCSAFATETIALDDPPGGPFANAYEPPTGYKCRMSIDGSADGPTPWYSGADPQVGSVADTGGLIFFQSSSSWSSTGRTRRPGGSPAIRSEADDLRSGVDGAHRTVGAVARLDAPPGVGEGIRRPRSLLHRP